MSLFIRRPGGRRLEVCLSFFDKHQFFLSKRLAIFHARISVKSKTATVDLVADLQTRNLFIQ
jgi:hypothetical protein